MFSMFCILASPLLTATPFPQHLDVLTNVEAIAVNQDPAGIQGICVRTNGNLQVWCKPLGSRDSNVKAVALLNRGTNAANITATWSDLGFSNGVVSVRDLWAKTNEGAFQTNYTANVPGHGVKLMKMVLQSSPPAGTNYLSDLNWLSVSATNTIHLDKDVLNHVLKMRSVTYTKGIGMLPTSSVQYFLGGGALRFRARIGVDDDAGSGGSVVFQVFADGTKLYDSGTMTGQMTPKEIDVDISGKQKFTLMVTDAGNGTANDYADWVNAYILIPAKASFGISRVNGSSVVFSGGGGSKNGSYYVLSATNVSLPFSQWKRAQTNYFDVSGNFCFTNGINAGVSNTFYRLEVP
jgi:alpha-galactosidase